MIIAVDFDGTCVTHEFPALGQDIGAAPVLKELVACGHKLILWTMRSDQETMDTSSDPTLTPIAHPYLTQAVEWFKSNDIPLWGINQNPEQHAWTSSPKVYAHLYIDDAAAGAPLLFDHKSRRYCIDWVRMREYLDKEGLLTPMYQPTAG
jgi:hypothetical protein